MMLFAACGLSGAWAADIVDKGSTGHTNHSIASEHGSIQFYGQTNKALLIYDDGGSTLGYFPVDNDSSSTRIGIRATQAFGADWSIGGNAEVEWNPYSTKYVNQLTRGEFDWRAHCLRKAEVYLESESVGSN